MELMRVFHQAFDQTNPDHMMLWEACCLGFFCFLRAGKFTVISAFDPVIHMTINNNIQLDPLVNPSCPNIHLKCSKTDPFHKGCDIYLRLSEHLPTMAIGNYWSWPSVYVL